MASVTERVKYVKFLSVAYTLHMSLCPKTPSNLWTILYLGQSFFFFCGRGSNAGPCIYYVLSMSAELSSRGLGQSFYNYNVVYLLKYLYIIIKVFEFEIIKYICSIKYSHC